MDLPPSKALIRLVDFFHLEGQGWDQMPSASSPALGANYGDPLQIPEPPSLHSAPVMRYWVLGSAASMEPSQTCPWEALPTSERETGRQEEEEDALLLTCWLLVSNDLAWLLPSTLNPAYGLCTLLPLRKDQQQPVARPQRPGPPF